MIKISGNVSSKPVGNAGKIQYSIAVNNFMKSGSTDKPETTWIRLDFANAGLEKYLAERLSKVNGKSPHVCISNGQLVTESYVHPKSGDKIVYLSLKIFDEKDVQKTVFAKGVNSSFNSASNVYANIIKDLEPFGTNHYKGRIAINHKTYTDKNGNEVKPAAYLNVSLFNVSDEVKETLKLGNTIKILKSNFQTRSYQNANKQNVPFTQLLVNEFEVITREQEKQSPPAPEKEEMVVTTNETPETCKEEEIPF